MFVTVNPINVVTNVSGVTEWDLEFQIQAVANVHPWCKSFFTFTVKDPGAQSERAWRDLADGFRKKICHSGGSINSTERDYNTGYYMTLRFETHGAVSSSYEVQRSVVSKPLLAAIDKAVELGCPFAESESD